MKPSTPAALEALAAALDAATDAWMAIDKATQRLGRIRGGAALHTRAQDVRDITSDFRRYLYEQRRDSAGLSLDTEAE